MWYKITDKGTEKLINLYDVKAPSAITKAHIALLEHIDEKRETGTGLLSLTKTWRESLGFTPTDMRVHPMGDKELRRTITSLAKSGYIILIDPYTHRPIPQGKD